MTATEELTIFQTWSYLSSQAGSGVDDQVTQLLQALNADALSNGQGLRITINPDRLLISGFCLRANADINVTSDSIVKSTEFLSYGASCQPTGTELGLMAAFSGAVTYNIMGNRLTLNGSDGSSWVFESFI